MLPIAFSSFTGCGFGRNFKFATQYFYNIFCSIVIGFDIYRIGEVISSGAKALVKGYHIGVTTVLHLLKNVGIRLNSQISANARTGNVAIIISGYRKMVTDILEDRGDKGVTGLFLMDKICLFSIDSADTAIKRLENCISYIREAADQVPDIENGNLGDPVTIEMEEAQDSFKRVL